MTLLQLLPELLFYILYYLGPDFFRQDICRLTVSKRWYDSAWKIYARGLQLTARSLKWFTHDEAVFIRSQPYITTVKLYLEGYKFSGPLSADRRGKKLDNADAVDEWTTQLDSSLLQLATVLQRCPSMRCLELKARPERRPELGLQRQGYLMAKPLADLVAVRHLASLKLDSAGSIFWGRACDSGAHFCRSVNALFPSLHRLHCRMDNICESLLEPPPHDRPCNLHEVIVNLSLSELSDTIPLYRYPRSCQSLSGETFSQLKEAIENQATALSHQLSNPRMVRVISHKFPYLGMYAFDAVTGQRVRLEAGTNWDAEGEVVYDEDDCEDESDLFNSDSPAMPEILP